MAKPNLYLHDDFQSFVARFEAISANTQPQWGKMNAAQMMEHCAEITEVFNGKELKNTPWFLKLFSRFIKKAVLNETPYKKNSPTHPQYIVADEPAFDKAKNRLMKALDDFHTMSPEDAINVKHTLFGKLSLEERSWGLYKHHNHHLEQFGV